MNPAARSQPTAKKRLLVVTASYPWTVDSINGIFVRDQVEALSRYFEITVLTAVFSTWRNRQPDASPVSHDRWVERKLSVFNPLSRSPVFSEWWLVRALTLEASHHRYDLIHAHNAQLAGRAARRIGRQQGIPFVVTEHTSPLARHVELPRNRRIMDQVLREASAVIAVSPFQAAELKRAFPRLQPVVIDNVVDTDFFQPMRSTGPGVPHRFVTIAGLIPNKNIGCLLEAARQLAADASAPAWSLDVIGDGELRTQLEKIVQRDGLTARIHFHGNLPRARVREVLQRADTLVHPSLHESFGLAVAEAMACGVRIICHDSGPTAHVLDGQGTMGDFRTPEALAAAMRSALADVPVDVEKLHHSIKNRFGSAAFTAKTLALYARL